jgi:leucyl aminopeptidase
MEFKLESSSLLLAKTDIAVAAVFQDEEIFEALAAEIPAKNKAAVETVASIIASALEDGFKGKAGQLLSLPTYGQLKCKRIILVGLGKRSAYTPSAMRKMAANMARRLSAGEKKVTVCFQLPLKAGGPAGKKSAASNSLQALVEGWILGSFSFRKYKTPSKDEKRAEINEISICGWTQKKDRFDQVCRIAQIIAESTNMARGFIAEPPSVMTPTKLSEEAAKIAKQYNMQCTILDSEGARKLGMGSFLGVARGAKEPAKFIAIRYAHKNAKKTVAIIGKGITFDSGGLSLKPAVSMEHMKYDMSGAAAVLGAMQVVGALKPACSVLAVIAATENMPGDAALHPGDVLTSMNGKTIEVNNTDAEGRLVLADALTYAIKQGADELIDIATLTGAIVTALGRAAAGVMGTDQPLVDRLIKSGADAGEKFWQMPLFDEYKESLKSDIADLKNAGSRGEAGSSSAGMFLREFVESKPWAHLDIAGPAWLDKDKDECNKGGTAFGVRTLSYYILNAASKS